MEEGGGGAVDFELLAGGSGEEGEDEPATRIGALGFVMLWSARWRREAETEGGGELRSFWRVCWTAVIWRVGDGGGWEEIEVVEFEKLRGKHRGSERSLELKRKARWRWNGGGGILRVEKKRRWRVGLSVMHHTISRHQMLQPHDNEADQGMHTKPAAIINYSSKHHLIFYHQMSPHPNPQTPAKNKK